jgi:hypothetical protein
VSKTKYALLSLCGCLWLFAGGCGASRSVGPEGAAGSAGEAGAGGAAGEVTSTGATSCLMPTASLSPKISTVGVVTFTTTGGAVTDGKIDFGLTTSYGMTAPLDVTATDYRTLLLGLKQTTLYHFRITARFHGVDGDAECVSDDGTLKTGALPAGLRKPAVTTNSTGSPLSGGFLLTGQYVMNIGSSGSPAYILDADGEYVWSYNTGKNVSAVRMSYDGKYVWINSVNVPGGRESVHRVSMDGLVDEDHTTEFAGLNHQLAVLPDETVAFYAYGANDCDDIKERAPSGVVRTIVNAKTARGGSMPCHVNNIQYGKEDDTLVFSDLDTSTITKVDRGTGMTVWSLGGATQTYGGTPWNGGQHGIQLLGLDRFLTFANNSTMTPGGDPAGGTGNGSLVLEVTLDNSAKSYTTRQVFKSTIQNDIMGDVQLMPNGNYVIAYSTRSVLQEVAPDGTLLQSWSWPLGAAFGYIEKRATLYGPPPR